MILMSLLYMKTLNEDKIGNLGSRIFISALRSKGKNVILEQKRPEKQLLAMLKDNNTVHFLRSAEKDGPDGRTNKMEMEFMTSTSDEM